MNEKCGDEYRRGDSGRHRKKCAKKKEDKCLNCHFYTKCSEEMDVAKKHAQPLSKQSMIFPFFEQELLLSPTTSSEKNTLIGEKNMGLSNGNPVTRWLT